MKSSTGKLSNLVKDRQPGWPLGPTSHTRQRCWCPNCCMRAGQPGCCAPAACVSTPQGRVHLFLSGWHVIWCAPGCGPRAPAKKDCVGRGMCVCRLLAALQRVCGGPGAAGVGGLLFPLHRNTFAAARRYGHPSPTPRLQDIHILNRTDRERATLSDSDCTCNAVDL